MGLEEAAKKAENDLEQSEAEIEESEAPKVYARKFAPAADDFNRHCATKKLVPNRRASEEEKSEPSQKTSARPSTRHTCHKYGLDAFESVE